jgi:DNA replication protein DnaC
MEIVEGRGARICVCRMDRLRVSRMAAIPPKFADVTIATLEPRPGIHPKQAQVIAAVKAEPEASYFLAGRFGTGKSMLMWALYRHAVDQGVRRVVVCTLEELIAEYRAFIQASMNREAPKQPRLTADELRQTHTKYAIFLDDIDKARPTEYAAEQFFAIVNAIYEFGHQIVTTTNLTPEKLTLHFGRADDRFGGAIVRRLTDGAKIGEMF